MKRKFNQGGLAEATGAAIRNRIAQMVAQQNTPEAAMRNQIAEITTPRIPETKTSLPPRNFGGPTEPISLPEMPANKSEVFGRRKAYVGDNAPVTPEHEEMLKNFMGPSLRRRRPMTPYGEPTFAKGGSVKSKGIDGCAQRGKTRGKYL